MKNQNYEVFMETDMSNYIGEWIAICDGKLVSHGKNIKEVFDETKSKCPGKKPLFAKIPEKETMIF